MRICTACTVSQGAVCWRVGGHFIVGRRLESDARTPHREPVMIRKSGTGSVAIAIKIAK